MPNKITTLPQVKDIANAAINKVKGKSLVQADSPDADGFSQLYKMVNGQRVDIDPKTSGGSSGDELTDETFAAKMDEQIGILTNIAKKLGYVTEWEKIQKMVRNGTFADHYAVGDQLTVKYNGNDTLWDIVAIDVAIPADTSKTHSVTLMPHDCLENLMFDNKEPLNSNSDRKEYGNNRYLYSNIRQWLNSSAAVGNWYTNQHSADAAPDYATTKPGFMSYFDSDFLAVIGKTKIVVVKNTVTDGGGSETLSNEYFYLPSTTEVGLANENNIAEGALFPYFSGNSKRKKYDDSGVVTTWYLRTPYSGGSRSVRRVDISGILNNSSVYYAFGITPVCNII